MLFDDVSCSHTGLIAVLQHAATDEQEEAKAASPVWHSRILLEISLKRA